MVFTQWFFYNVVLGIKEFVHIQMAVIFILFAVGVYYYPAYVFVDHWLHTQFIVEDKEDYVCTVCYSSTNSSFTQFGFVSF